MLTRMARTGCGSHGSIPLRLHQRNGSLAGADLAGTVRAIRLPAEVGDCRARFPGRAGSLTGAVLPRVGPGIDAGEAPVVFGVLVVPARGLRLRHVHPVVGAAGQVEAVLRAG